MLSQYLTSIWGLKIYLSAQFQYLTFDPLKNIFQPHPRGQGVYGQGFAYMYVYTLPSL